VHRRSSKIRVLDGKIKENLSACFLFGNRALDPSVGVI